MSVIIVGGGLAGLTCARQLRRRNIDVVVLEASDDVGGRVRSDLVDGFTLDRGFQVLFDAYPAVIRNLDLAALDLKAFEPGAIISYGGRRTALTDPLRDRRPADVISGIVSSTTPLLDKLRTLRLALSLYEPSRDQRDEDDRRTTEAYLRAEGYSERTLDRFFRPFFGGIFLERELQTTAAAFRFYFRMLAVGRAALPAKGMGAITRQLAEPLRVEGSVRCNSEVVALLKEDGRVTGVRLGDGSELRAEAVVLATDGPAVAHLVDLPVPSGSREVTAIYLAGLRPLYRSRKIVLNAEPDAFVNNVQQLSNVAPGYAPPGRHLLSAAILGVPELDDRALVVATMRDLRRVFAGDDQALTALESYYPLRIYRIRYAQFPQLPGVYEALPGNRTNQAGLYVAAEWTEGSCINGAMTSGERCAAAIVDDLRG